MSVQSISPNELQALIAGGTAVDLIDVRTPAEFQGMHAPFARNVPLQGLAVAQYAKQRTDLQRPLYVICQSGSRGRQACEQLHGAGVTQVFNVEGGTQAWHQLGLPVVTGRTVISLERQVRIAAGALVVLGAALSVLVHPYWIGLAAFVGAGLVFAGVTDTCCMALLLARMPWNQRIEMQACPAQSSGR